MSKYDEIINLPHHVSQNRKQMSLYDRAAQFAPFAALTGHDEAIDETARLTCPRIELSPDEQRTLSIRLAYAVKHKVAVTVRYFRADPFKEGGTYLTAHGSIKKIDEYEAALVLSDGIVIPLADIYSITAPVFNEIE